MISEQSTPCYDRETSTNTQEHTMISEQSTPCYDISFLIGHFCEFLSLVLNICCSVLYRNFFLLMFI